MNKVVFFTEGGSRTGLGHLTRCAALADAIKERYPDTEVKFVVKDAECARDLLKGIETKVVDFDWYKDNVRTMEEARGSSLIVIDSYVAEKSIYDGISEVTSGRLLMLDDYGRLDYPEGIVINPSIGNGASARGSQEEGTYLTGGDYVILRKEFRDVPQKEIRETVKDVLLTFGGKDHSSFIDGLAGYLLNKYDFNLHVVFSGDTSCLSSTDKGKNRIRIYSDLTAKGMLDLILICDLSISGGGQTLYELANCGVPTIGICMAENQMGNIKALAETGFLEYIGRYDEGKITEKMEQAIERLLSKDAREKVSNIGKGLVDGRGAIRIVERSIHKDPQLSLRQAGDGDSRDLWAWRNDPEVRRWCFQREEIRYEEHEKWFRNKMRDSNVKIYIAEEECGKVGQARFDTDSGRTCISVNLNPAYLGKRMGGRIISLATRRFFEETPDVEKVEAEIAVDNIASRKAFSKAGYGFSHKGSKGDREMDVYVSERRYEKF